MRMRTNGRAMGLAVALGLVAALSTNAAPLGSGPRDAGTLEAWVEAIGSWWDGLATWLAGPVGSALEPLDKEGVIRDPNGVPGAPTGGGG